MFTFARLEGVLHITLLRFFVAFFWTVVRVTGHNDSSFRNDLNAVITHTV